MAIELGDFDLDVRHPGSLKDIAGTSFKDFAVVAFERLPVDPDARTFEIDDPELPRTHTKAS